MSTILTGQACRLLTGFAEERDTQRRLCLDRLWSQVPSAGTCRRACSSNGCCQQLRRAFMGPRQHNSHCSQRETHLQVAKDKIEIIQRWAPRAESCAIPGSYLTAIMSGMSSARRVIPHVLLLKLQQLARREAEGSVYQWQRHPALSRLLQPSAVLVNRPVSLGTAASYVSQPCQHEFAALPQCLVPPNPQSSCPARWNTSGVDTRKRAESARWRTCGSETCRKHGGVAVEPGGFRYITETQRADRQLRRSGRGICTAIALLGTIQRATSLKVTVL
jgi:hypothetical protein